jgi:hypothetical protein
LGEADAVMEKEKRMTAWKAECPRIGGVPPFGHENNVGETLADTFLPRHRRNEAAVATGVKIATRNTLNARSE